MIISIHQPQYLPWLPYYSKISNSDLFVFLDDVQYQKNGLHNRNELKNSNGRFWLTIPVSASFGDKLFEVEILNDSWVKKHIKSIRFNYSKAKNFMFFEKYIEPIISRKYSKLVDINIKLIETISRDYFNINTKFVRQSDIITSGEGTELILEICQKTGSKKYISGPGGKNYLNEDEFKKKQIDIIYLKNSLPLEYPQLYPKQSFINDISALDFILNVGGDWLSYYEL